MVLSIDSILEILFVLIKYLNVLKFKWISITMGRAPTNATLFHKEIDEIIWDV